MLTGLSSSLPFPPLDYHARVPMQTPLPARRGQASGQERLTATTGPHAAANKDEMDDKFKANGGGPGFFYRREVAGGGAGGDTGVRERQFRGR